MDTIITLALLGIYLGALALDFLAPARAFPAQRFWRLRGLASFVVYVAIATFAPLFWDGWLGAHRLLDATGLGPWLGALAALLAVSFGSYWWHRALHRVPMLWRVHQMHHSAERVDIFGAFWFHPLDGVGFAFVASFMMVMVVGVGAEAALLANAVITFAAVFQHANLRTPTWIGYFLQRPESHSIHHERGVHRHNYGDIAIWDIVFGTFRNPPAWQGVGGFYDGASERVVDMLLLRDVSERPQNGADAERVSVAKAA